MKTGGHARAARQEKVLQALKAGNTRKASYQYAAVPEATFFNWLSGDASFLELVEQAEAQAEVTCASSILKAATRDWRAAEAWLKRRRGADWREINHHEVSGPDGGPIEYHDHSAQLDDKVLGILARTRGEEPAGEPDS